MDKEEKQPGDTMALPESPASLNTRMKTPEGFIIQWTIRDEKNSTLLYKFIEMQKKWIAMGWTPVENYSKFDSKQYQKPPVEYVEGRKCPKCQSPLIYSKKKDGIKFIKCSTNKYDWKTKTASGCDFVKWMDNPYEDLPSRDVNDF